MTEEAAERERAIENVLKIMKQSITALDQMLRSLITSSIEQLRAEFWKMLEDLERKFMEHKIWTIEELNRIQKVFIFLSDILKDFVAEGVIIYKK